MTVRGAAVDKPMRVVDDANESAAAPSAGPATAGGRAADAGFGKGRRLLTPADFSQVFDSTLLKHSTDDCLMCLAAPAAGPRGRIGLAIAKRNVRTAVGRNLVKRVVRDRYRRQGPALDGHDIVVLGRHATAAATAEALATSIDAHFARLQRLEFRPAKPRPPRRRGRR